MQQMSGQLNAASRPSGRNVLSAALVTKGSLLSFAAPSTKARSGPVVTIQCIWAGHFANVAICALLPSELTAAKVRNPPF